MDSKLYQRLCLRTKSDQYNIDLINLDDFKQTISILIETLYTLDQFKSKLYYGKDKNKQIQSEFYYNLDELDLNNINPDLLHSIMGLATEAGELFEELISPEQDKNHYIGEFGDCEWFINLGYSAIDTDSDVVRTKNILKLKTRYGEKFSEDNAIFRNLENEYSSYKT